MMYRQNKKYKNGFVMIVVLGIIMLLMVLLLGFTNNSRKNLYSSDDFVKSQQALNCARTGLNIAIAAITHTPDEHTESDITELLSEQKTIQLDPGQCSILVTEENAGLNVNLLTDKNGKLNRTMADSLLRLIDIINKNRFEQSRISYSLIPSIIDWIDADDRVTCLPFIMQENRGEESAYYQQLKDAYKCKNAKLDTTAELLLIKGITSDIFDCLHDHITVYGDGKVNINFASAEVIESLSERIDPAIAQMIVERRRIKKFDSLPELREVPGMTDVIYNSIAKSATVEPDEQYYHVTLIGSVDDIEKTITAVLKKNKDAEKVDILLCNES